MMMMMMMTIILLIISPGGIVHRATAGVSPGRRGCGVIVTTMHPEERTGASKPTTITKPSIK